MKNQDYQIKETHLIFLHIPKAGGRTFHSILNKLYKPSERYLIAGIINESIKDFQNLTNDQRENIKLLMGHMPFGLHKYFNNPSIYITMLRNPIDRILSLYYYILRTPTHYLYNVVAGENMSLEDFIYSDILEIDNLQTRLLSGSGRDVGFGECSKKLLDISIKNIHEYFAVVGISERFDETLLLMKNELGWKRVPLYLRGNVTKKRPRKKDIPKKIIEKIESLNCLDRELYEYFKKSFNEKINEQGDFFANEVKKYNKLNSLYQQYFSVPMSLLQTLRRIIKARIHL